jgi:S-adenosylmethionine hydrolase
VIVALLTDFGTRDHYVGSMKGVVLSVCPEATLVDISHEIPPQDMLGAALELNAAYRYFPAGTVFLVVVDPGVGSARRGIAADAGGYRFVGPDNGVLSLALEDAAVGGKPAAVVELTERRFARPEISRTFEGRDRFAPAAGWLARGVELASFGPPIVNAIRLEPPVAIVTSDGVEGQVMRVDRFGNLVTNIEAPMLPREGAVRVLVAGHDIRGVVGTYADAPPGALCALIGSTGHLEIAVCGGSAANTLGVGRGERVHLRPGA